MLLKHLPHQRLNPMHFGENRTVNIMGIGALKNAIGGAMSKMKGDTATMKEGASKTVGFLKKPFYAKSTLGYITKSPFILARKAYEGSKFLIDTGARAARSVGEKVGEVLKKPVGNIVSTTRDLTKKMLNAGANLTINPLLQVGKSNLIDFPERALVKQFRSGISHIFSTAFTAVGTTFSAGVTALKYPFAITASPFLVAKDILYETPKAALQGDTRGALKTLFSSPWHVAKAVTSLPAAIAAIPVKTGIEMGIGGLATAANIGSAVAAPAEGIVNAYRSMGKISELKLSETKGYRDRITDIFKNITPFRANNLGLATA